jgi:glycosyltransferase involved in cell wall biosynthesis
MRIAIDARVLDRAITGTGRYLLNVLKELPNQDKKNEYFIFAGNELAVDKKYFRMIYFKQSKIPMKLYSPIWLNVILPKLLKKYKIDLLVAPNILVPIVNLNGVRCISIVHDVIPKVYKEYYPFFYKLYLSIFLPLSLNKSDRIVTVSELSKNDIAKYYDIPKNKIRVVYNTASDIFKQRDKSNEIQIRLNEENYFPKKYLLYVGVIEKRKNIFGLIKILDLLKEKGSELELVIVGKPGYDYKNLHPELDKRKKSIKHFKYLEDETLAYVYNNAFAFIFPSFYEGFGIPPLEAMQSGIPVLTSNTSSLVEVVGDGGLLHDPQDYMGFVNDILKLENDSGFYTEMQLKALKQAGKFNIKETAQKLVGVFDEL